MTKATIQSTKDQMPRVAKLNNNLQIPIPICPRIKRSTPNPPNRLLIDIYSIFHKEERQIVFASMNPKLKESFKRTGLISMVGEEAIYPSVNEFLLDLVDKNK